MSFAASQYQVPTAWTPTLVGTTTAGVVVYTNQVGTYINFGTMAIAWFNIAWSATTGTGNTTVTGLPVSCASDVGVTFSPAWMGFTLPMGAFEFLCYVAGTTITFATLDPSATATPLALPAAGSLSGSFIFPVGS